MLRQNFFKKDRNVKFNYSVVYKIESSNFDKLKYRNYLQVKSQTLLVVVVAYR